jgi:hypothetical protein
MALKIARSGRRFGPTIVTSRRRIVSDYDYEVAVGSGGWVLAVWTRYDRTRAADPYSRDDDCCHRARALLVPPSGRVARRTGSLSPRRMNALLGPAAIDGRGRAVVTWQRNAEWGSWHGRAFDGARWLRRQVLATGASTLAGAVRFTPAGLLAVAVSERRRRPLRVIRRVADARMVFGAPQVVDRVRASPFAGSFGLGPDGGFTDRPVALVDNRRRLYAVRPARARAAASARPPVELGVQDEHNLVRDSGFLAESAAFAALRDLRAKTVRMNVTPQDDLGRLARAVDRAIAHGLRVQMTLSGQARRPDPAAFGRFAGDVARRFAGRVSRYSIWNEPNWHTYLLPRRRAPELYRPLYQAAYEAIKAVDPAIEVLIGELAPMGRVEAAMPPLQFLRRLTCSDRERRARRPCAPLRADGFAHHPYTLRWAPEYPGPGRDDVTSGSLGRLTRALRALARRGALATPEGASLPLFLTEWGYHADSERVPEPIRSRHVRRGLALMARRRDVWQIIWCQLGAPPRRRDAERTWDTALIDRRGRARPVYRAVRAWSSRLP